MSFPDLTDLALGAVTKTLGESVTYTPRGGSPLTIDGIYSDKVYEIDGGSGTPVLTKKCLLEVQISAFGATPPAQFDSVTIRGVAYQVLEVDPDGAGAATLHLRKT